MIRVLVQYRWKLVPVGKLRGTLPEGTDASAWEKPGKGEIVIDNTGWLHNDESGRQADFGSGASDLQAYLSPHKTKPTSGDGLQLSDQDKGLLKSMGIKGSRKKADGGRHRFIDDEWREILEANGYRPRTEPDPEGRGSGYAEEIWRNPHTDLQVQIGHTDDGGDPFWATISSDGMDVEGTDTEDLLEIIGEELAGKEPPVKHEKELNPEDKEMLKSMGIIGRIRNAKGKIAGRPAMFSFVVPLKAAGAVAFHLAKAGMENFEAINYAEDDATMFVFKNEPEMHVAEEIVKAEFADLIGRRKGAWALWAPQEKDVSALPGYGTDERQHLVSGKKEAAFDADLLNSVAKRELVAELVKIRQNEDMDRLDMLIRSLKAPKHPEGGYYRGKQFRGGPRLVQSGQKVAGQWGERSYDSDQVHDILDKYRPKMSDPGGENSKGFDEPVPDENLPALLKDLDKGDPVPGHDDDQGYLGAVVFLVTHGSAVPPLYRDRARNIAEMLAGDTEYLQEWKSPQERQAELEKEIDILSRPATGKTALKLPEDLQYVERRELGGPGMTDAEIKKMDRYRRKKLLAWIDELGLDLSEELRKYDEGDFWTRDEVYEEVRDMIREDRRFQSGYRRSMRGRPVRGSSVQKKGVLPPPPPPLPHAEVRKAPAPRKPAPPAGSPAVSFPGMQDIYIPHVEHEENAQKIQEKLDMKRMQQEQEERRGRLTGVASKREK
jgi:hypothetical protein